MPASTPAPWSIPYPVGTDRVADGDNSMQAIAERVAVIDNALPRGLIVQGTQAAGSITVSSETGLFTLPTIVTTEARDFQFVLSGTIRNVAGTGTGLSYIIRHNTAVMFTHTVVPAFSNFDASWSASLVAVGIQPGSHAFTFFAAAYGANGNTTSANQINVIDLGASGAI